MAFQDNGSLVAFIKISKAWTMKDKFGINCDNKQLLQEGKFHLLHLLATKGHKFSKEKLHIVQNQVQYLRYFISEQGVHLDRSQKPSWHLVFPQT